MTGSDSPPPNREVGTFRALRDEGVVRMYLQPISTLARVVQRSLPRQRSNQRDSARSVTADLALVRHLAMAVSAVFFIVGLLPIGVARELDQPYRFVALFVGATVVLVPAATALIAQLTAAMTQPKGLLGRVAHGSLGRQLDSTVWFVSAVVGAGVGYWLSTQV